MNARRRARLLYPHAYPHRGITVRWTRAFFLDFLLQDV